MAELPVEKRRFLEEMKNCIEEEDKWLRDIMNYLGWSIEDLPKILEANSSRFEVCPFNNEHRVPEDSIEAHISTCSKKHGTYPDARVDGPCFYDDSASHSTNVHLTLLRPSAEDSVLPSQSSSSRCLIELLTAERDAKRRRATYRKKSIHSNKKTYNEILRELIDNEMKTLECGLKTEDNPESSSNTTNEKEGRTTKNSAYAGIGNWIYHENPYKRWKTIAEEEKELLKTRDDGRRRESCISAKHSVDKLRHSREYYHDSARRRQRRHSDRRSKHSHFRDYSKRRERSHSKRSSDEDHFDDGSKRSEKTHPPKYERRHEEKHRRSDFSGRPSSRRSNNSSDPEPSRSPDRGRKCSKYRDEYEKTSCKHAKRYPEPESRTSDASRESEVVEKSVENSKILQSNRSSDESALEKTTSVLNAVSKHDHKDRYSDGSRDSSNSNNFEKKHRKKKKKHEKKRLEKK